MIDIKPYVYEKNPNGVGSFVWYFHLEGGTDEERNGHFLWMAYYCIPSITKHRENKSAYNFCRDEQIPCGTGKTPEEAIENLKEEIRKHKMDFHFLPC